MIRRLQGQGFEGPDDDLMCPRANRVAALVLTPGSFSAECERELRNPDSKNSILDSVGSIVTDQQARAHHNP